MDPREARGGGHRPADAVSEVAPRPLTSPAALASIAIGPPEMGRSRSPRRPFIPLWGRRGFRNLHLRGAFVPERRTLDNGRHGTAPREGPPGSLRVPPGGLVAAARRKPVYRPNRDQRYRTDPRSPQGESVLASGPRGDLSCAPRLAHQPGPLLPHGDPFGDLGQVGAGGDAQSGLVARPTRPRPR
jgi:hypothetical protein